MTNQQSSGFSSESKKRIWEHLAKSSGGEINFQRIPQNFNPQVPTPQISTTKTSRMEHIKRSQGNYNLLSSGSQQERKNRIMNHIKITRG